MRYRPSTKLSLRAKVHAGRAQLCVNVDHVLCPALLPQQILAICRLTDFQLTNEQGEKQGVESINIDSNSMYITGDAQQWL